MTILEHYLSDIQEPVDEIVTMSTALTAYSLATIAATIYKNFISKNGRRCRAYEGAEKATCITQVKLEGKDQQQRSLRQQMMKCGNSRCRNKLQDKIYKLDDEIDVLKQRLKIYQGKAEADAQAKKDAEGGEEG